MSALCPFHVPVSAAQAPQDGGAYSCGAGHVGREAQTLPGPEGTRRGTACGTVRLRPGDRGRGGGALVHLVRFHIGSGCSLLTLRMMSRAHELLCLRACADSLGSSYQQLGTYRNSPQNAQKFTSEGWRIRSRSWCHCVSNSIYACATFFGDATMCDW